MNVGDRVLFVYPEGDADYGVVLSVSDVTVSIRLDDGREILTIPESVERLEVEA